MSWSTDIAVTAVRYLLCRPEGGLNDVLCQIGKCAQYAEDFYRILVIDTQRTIFSVPFGNYFTPRAPWIVDADPDILSRLDGLTALPGCIDGRITSYRSHYWPDALNFVEESTKTPISFDFGKDYDTPLLVHHACGGGEDSLACLRRFRVNRPVADKLAARLAIIGNEYSGIHVRHTDYQTDYQAFFSSLLTSGKLAEPRPILLCTDNLAVINYGKGLFGASIHTFSTLPDNGSAPLHRDASLDKTLINCDAILDLLMLAKSSMIHATETTGGHLSGYTQLALNLHDNPDVLTSLLAVPR